MEKQRHLVGPLVTGAEAPVLGLFTFLSSHHETSSEAFRKLGEDHQAWRLPSPTSFISYKYLTPFPKMPDLGPSLQQEGSLQSPQLHTPQRAEARELAELEGDWGGDGED